MSGRLIGIDTGPGDPELLTLKAVRALAAADVVAHFAKAGRSGNARATVAGFLRRFVLVAMVGSIAAIATNFSYWNWYGFNLDYTVAQAFTEVMKFVCAGAVIAWVFGWRRLRKA